MNLAKANYQLLLSCIVIVLIATITSLEAIEKVISTADTATFAKQPLGAIEVESSYVAQKYNIPFLILLSSDEICVVQLPLIDNGTVSVAYRLSNKQQQSVAEENQPRENESASVAAIADAREYEQMPQSTSLGKSDGQQIASNRKYAVEGEEVGSAIVPTFAPTTASMTLVTTPATTRTEGSSEDAAEDSAKDDTRFPRRIRRRRRSSGSSSNLDDSTDGTLSNNSSTNAAPESGPQQNVTSALFSSSIKGSTDEEEAREEGTYSAPQEEDDKNSNVQFSDFDVHMALGYAFVADSLGRIHRFRLSGSEKPHDYLNLGKGLSPTTEQEYSDAEYTNTIDGVAARSNANPAKRQLLSYWSSSSGTKNPGLALNISKENDAYANADDESNDDNANKVGQDSVTHEQSGRHPTDSGSSVSIDDNVNGSSDGQLSGAATSGARFATDQVSTQQKRLMRYDVDAKRNFLLFSIYRRNHLICRQFTIFKAELS